jgi:hypothetical protein
MVAEIGDVREGMAKNLIRDLWKEADKAVKDPRFGKKKMWIRVCERPDDFHWNVQHRTIKIFDKKPTPLVNTMVWYCDYEAGVMKLIRCLPKNTRLVLPEHLESQNVDEVLVGSVGRMIDHYV